MRRILIKPVVTEKMSAISEKGGKYGFIVAVDANKIEIAKAIKEKFNVDVDKINTTRYDGKVKTQLTKKGRFSGKKPQYKKALITLKKGQTIDLFGEV
jgi:large subunit ribosomal protein L23